MFPTLNYLINYLFGTDIQLNFPPTFGTLVALSFLAAAWMLRKEMVRKAKQGLIPEVKIKITKGAAPTLQEGLVNGLIGGFIGLKVGALLLGEAPEFGDNPQGFILSLEGNWLTALVGALAFGGYAYYDKKRKALPTPEVTTQAMPMADLVSGITLNAAGYGILGAKLFHNLEYFDAFMADPLGSLFSVTGLTFYGGLIGGFYGVRRFVRKRGIPTIHIADAVAPALILAYGIGRIGCLLSGDGDWGVVNSAYRISEDRQYQEIPLDTFQIDAQKYFFYYNAPLPSEVPHVYQPKPAALSFLPDWFFAFDFPHNVNNEGIPITGCEGTYCSRLPLPVFPTMIYEIGMALLIFVGLWSVRGFFSSPGQMFGAYLMANGVERFLIEQIRVNAEMHLLGITFTQAELIAVVLVGAGLLMLVQNKRLQPWLMKI